jgi:hypothetical protein
MENATHKAIRIACIVLPIVAIAIGTVSLFGGLPYDYYPYFWDGGNLLSDISEPDFLTEGGGTTYALRKFGYAAPIYYCVRWFGRGGVLVVNLFWFAVILGVGLWRFARQREWTGALCFAAGIICLPYVHKYIGMANPTIQSMALWFILFLSYDRGGTKILRGTVWPGLLFGALVLTDFPKWAIVAIPAILVVEFVAPILAERRVRSEAMIRAAGRSALIFAYGIVAFLGATLINSNYISNNITQAVLIESGIVDGFRIGLSWNYPLFLWVLGGFWVLAFVLIFWKSAASERLRSWPGVLLALAVVAIFSLVLWPRGARMFAVTLPFLIFLFASLVQQVCNGNSDSRSTIVARIAAVCILAGFVVRGFFAGDCYRLETGISEIHEAIQANHDIPPDALIGVFLSPVFGVGSPGDYDWQYLGRIFEPGMDWIVTGDNVDDIVIAEQLYSGAKTFEWQRLRIKVLHMIMEQPVFAETSCEFYVSKWYLTETNFDDNYMASLLRRRPDFKDSKWRVHYVGAIFGREME